MSKLRSRPQASVHAATFGAHSDGLLFVARVLLAGVFLYSGAVKLLGWQAAVGEFDLPLTITGPGSFSLQAGSRA